MQSKQWPDIARKKAILTGGLRKPWFAERGIWEIEGRFSSAILMFSTSVSWDSWPMGSTALSETLCSFSSSFSSAWTASLLIAFFKSWSFIRRGMLDIWSEFPPLESSSSSSVLRGVSPLSVEALSRRGLLSGHACETVARNRSIASPPSRQPALSLQKKAYKIVHVYIY